MGKVAVMSDPIEVLNNLHHAIESALTGGVSVEVQQTDLPAFSDAIDYALALIDHARRNESLPKLTRIETRIIVTHLRFDSSKSDHYIPAPYAYDESMCELLSTQFKGDFIVATWKCRRKVNPGLQMAIRIPPLTKELIERLYDTPKPEEPPNMNRVGDWIQTYTGKRFYPLDPRIEEIDILDIAHALSNQCRFAGHTRTFYSVAEHSVRVAAYLLSLMGWNIQLQDVRRIALTALLHDASEAYLIDIPRPIKRDPQMSFYIQAERNLEYALAVKYDLLYPYPPDIHKADNKLLITERRDLLTIQRPDWDVSLQTITPLPNTIVPLSPSVAKLLFVKLFDHLCNPPQVASDQDQAFIITTLTVHNVNPGLQMPTANVKDMMPVLAITKDGKMFFGYSGFSSFQSLVDNVYDTESVYIHGVRTIVVRDYTRTPITMYHPDSYWWAPFLANHGPDNDKLDDDTLKFLVSPSAPSSLIESIAQVYLVATQATKAWELDTSSPSQPHNTK